MKKHLIVIGGGMAGTSAAYHLKKKGYDVTILEKNDRLGGRIHSITTTDAIFEVGAGFITDIYTNVFAFLKEQKLEKYLQKRKSRAVLVKKGELQWFLSGKSVLGNSLISTGAKILFFKEMLRLIPQIRFFAIHNLANVYRLDTKTIAAAFSAKDGQELIDYLIQPALDGYCYWSAERISYAMLLLFLKIVLVRQKTYILKCGLQRIPESAAVGSKVLLSHTVTQVKKVSQDKYEVTVTYNNKTKKLLANGIVCATTATEVLKVLELTKLQKSFFSNISYSSTALVAKTYLPERVPSNYAIAYPRKEHKTIGAVTIVSDTARDAQKLVTLVKFYTSGKKGKELCEEKDDVIDKTLTKEAVSIDKLFHPVSDPTCRYIQKWQEAIPEFTVGSFKRLHRFVNGEIESQNNAIVFAGDYLAGPFIEGAFTSGKEAAQRLDQKMQN